MWVYMRYLTTGLITFFLLIALAALTPARADVYMYKDKDGVTHFTNIRPKGKKFKRLYKTGPGKASRRRCKRCDVVPARDRSPKRFSRYDKFIEGASRLYKIPEALIRAVIQTESDYDPRVVSSAGAKGLMQLMPVTARHMGVTDVYDPRQNIYGGVRYLRVLANRFHGNILLTLAGYHAGPGAVSKYRGIPPYETTQRYVRVVIKRYYRYQKRAAAKRSATAGRPGSGGGSDQESGADGAPGGGAGPAPPSTRAVPE